MDMVDAVVTRDRRSEAREARGEAPPMARPPARSVSVVVPAPSDPTVSSGTHTRTSASELDSTSTSGSRAGSRASLAGGLMSPFSRRASAIFGESPTSKRNSSARRTSTAQRLTKLQRITNSRAFRASHSSITSDTSSCEELSVALAELTSLAEADTQVSINDLRLVRKLGEGAFGQVSLYVKAGCEKVAVKLGLE